MEVGAGNRGGELRHLFVWERQLVQELTNLLSVVLIKYECVDCWCRRFDNSSNYIVKLAYSIYVAGGWRN